MRDTFHADFMALTAHLTLIRVLILRRPKFETITAHKILRMTDKSSMHGYRLDKNFCRPISLLVSFDSRMTRRATRAPLPPTNYRSPDLMLHD